MSGPQDPGKPVLHTRLALRGPEHPGHGTVAVQLRALRERGEVWLAADDVEDWLAQYERATVEIDPARYGEGLLGEIRWGAASTRVQEMRQRFEVLLATIRRDTG